MAATLWSAAVLRRFGERRRYSNTRSDVPPIEHTSMLVLTLMLSFLLAIVAKLVSVALGVAHTISILDLALMGKTATIAAIEQDFEDRIHIAVTVDEDPGRDFGARGQPGHRFFFRPDEVEPLEDDAPRS